MHHLSRLISARSSTFFLAVALALAACVYIPPAPDPAAVAAANRVAADISDYRASRDLGAELSDPALATFARVYDRVKHEYVRPVEEEALLGAAREGIRKSYPNPKGVSDTKLMMAAVNGMLSSLDRYSTYLDPPEWKAMREQTRGEFGGLGIEVRKGDDGILVIAPIDGTPAFRADMKAGDIVTHADGKPLAELSLRDSVRLLRGKPGTSIVLTVSREGKPPFDVEIVREVVRVSGIRWRLEGDIGYLRVSAFTRNVGHRLEDAVEQIRDRLGGRLQGLVLDLRNNPGGLFDESIRISDDFLESGRIVSTRGRHSEVNHEAEPGDIVEGLPIVILINKGSASASEIVAGALHDHKRAVLVGTKTFGKGTVQTLIPLGGKDAVRLTTAIYLTPSGRSVDGGIEPDVTVEIDEEREGDEQLERALQTLREMAPRRS